VESRFDFRLEKEIYVEGWCECVCVCEGVYVRECVSVGVCVTQQVAAPLGPARCPNSFSRHTTGQQSRDIHHRCSAALACFSCVTVKEHAYLCLSWQVISELLEVVDCNSTLCTGERYILYLLRYYMYLYLFLFGCFWIGFIWMNIETSERSFNTQ
jgi:hypothetical protein